MSRVPTSSVTETLLICSDIFGVTAELNALSDQLSGSAKRLIVVGPYESQSKCFQRETVAYQAFCAGGGVNAYADKILSLLETSSAPIKLIAFSAGASAVWKVLGEKTFAGVQQFTGFYPGQIRHYLDLSPKLPISLVFPRNESHFELAPILRELEGKESINVIKTPFRHGFMNPLSAGFDPSAYDQYLTFLKAM